MTTRSLEIERDGAASWWLLRDAGPLRLDVLSLVARRRANETVAGVAAELAVIVGEALGQVPELKLSLLYLGATVPITGKVDALLQDRKKLWLSLENDGVPLPAGARTERNVSLRTDRNRYFGAIRCEADQLVSALDLTRRNNAVCLVSPHGEPELRGWEDMVITHAFEQDAYHFGVGSLLRAVAGLLPQGAFVIRSYGDFDDLEIAIYIVAEDELVDKVQAALARILE